MQNSYDMHQVKFSISLRRFLNKRCVSSSSAVIVTISLGVSLLQLTALESSPIFYNFDNCSQYYPAKEALIPVDKLLGDWNYSGLYNPSKNAPQFNLNCFTLSNSIEQSKHQSVIIRFDLRAPNSKNEMKSATLFGSVHETVENHTSSVHLLSQGIHAPAQWINLSYRRYKDTESLLYLICGDLPDGSSAVGEIGILSRGLDSQQENFDAYYQILSQYDLWPTMSPVTHVNCR